MKSSPNPAVKLALVVHPDLSVLSKFQEAFTQAGMTTLLARDLPTALVAISQNNFEVAVISWRVTESGDGWPLGAILRRIFENEIRLVQQQTTRQLEVIEEQKTETKVS